MVREMRTAHTCVVSRGPYPGLGPDMLEIFFDDGSDTPFSLHLSPGAIDRMPLDRDTLETWVLSVWTHRVGTSASKALELPCHYRRVRRLPALRPWPGCAGAGQPLERPRARSAVPGRFSPVQSRGASLT